MYKYDPFYGMNLTDTQKQLVLGGEVAYDHFAINREIIVVERLKKTIISEQISFAFSLSLSLFCGLFLNDPSFFLAECGANNVIVMLLMAKFGHVLQLWVRSLSQNVAK
jgi:hypothetical protein